MMGTKVKKNLNPNSPWANQPYGAWAAMFRVPSSKMRSPGMGVLARPILRKENFGMTNIIL